MVVQEPVVVKKEAEASEEEGLIQAEESDKNDDEQEKEEREKLEKEKRAAIERDLERINPIKKEREHSKRSKSGSHSKYPSYDLDRAAETKIRKNQRRCSSVKRREAIATVVTTNTIASTCRCVWWCLRSQARTTNN